MSLPPTRRPFKDEDENYRFYMVAKERCEQCNKKLEWDKRGWETPDHWEAHHKDGDRSNNSPYNLQILCWGCHDEISKGTLPKLPRTPLP